MPLLTWSIALASLSAFLGSLDSALNISFPAITAAFSLEVSSIQWVIIGYVLPHASLLLGCGRLGDLLGHGRLLLWGLLISSLGFLGCGLAPGFSWLVAARVVQGVGMALISGSAPALVTLAVAPERRGQALGLLQMSMAAGYALGPLIGGLLVDAFGWRAVFLFRFLPALILAWLAAARLSTARLAENRQSFDLVGALTFAGSLAAILLAISQSRHSNMLSAQVMIPGLASVLGLFAFIRAERKGSSPVVDLRFFQRVPFVIANLLGILANAARFAVGLLVPYYVIDVLRYSAATGGTLMLAAAIMTPLAAPVAGKLSDRLGTAGLSALGLLLEGLGLWMISRLDGQADYLSVALALGIVGLGLGVFEAPNMSFVMGSIPRDQQGVAGGIANMMRTLGIVFGATGWSMLFDGRRQLHSQDAAFYGAPEVETFVLAFQDVFLCAAAICAAALLLALFRRHG
ncbi:MAG TPA: MFS transporter [Candidatus Binatia bacterium]|nr:MFS transporter [Candidatus Binatia bacterium]